MLQQATDVVTRQVRQASVADLVVEQRFPALPQALVHMHAGPVVLKQRLGHEGDRVASRLGDVLDDVLERHEVVGGLQQGAEPEVDLCLTGGADLVVLHLDVDARRHEDLDHF